MSWVSGPSLANTIGPSRSETSRSGSSGSRPSALTQVFARVGRSLSARVSEVDAATLVRGAASTSPELARSVVLLDVARVDGRG
ncbi:hypothetical protein [Gordonia soli]|uniref:Uncharacterized protein n=1 Tax=Gordonia soli NBRC 108243 TaxID=1223545 RepID=M0QP70_9ACTN|nr:hypothetical protein [Gordonia soli]GAC70076.1 hypothetical protein GS4_32_00200 [Gordonia soli NBRC 108243]